ncbi:MAG TPA: hypothetical protein VLR88_00140, partial [Propionibacteriaceae bacterium]|nr:hypothetical protein [Propionibacteriaceae bacterium]
LDHYTALAELRREHECLRVGGLRWVVAGDDVIAFVRETSSDACLVVVTRHAAGLEIVTDQLAGIERGTTVLGEGFEVREGRVGFSASDAGVAIWAWTKD